MSLLLLFGDAAPATIEAKVSWLALDTAAPAVGVITGTLAATESGSDTAAFAGQVIVQGSASATETGADTAALVGQVIVQGALAATEVGSDTANLNGSSVVTTTGTLDATESGSDTAALVGSVLVQGSASAQEAGSDTAAIAGQVIVQGTLAALEVGSDTAALQGGALPIIGTLDATETGADTASMTGKVLVQASIAAQESGQDTAALAGQVFISGVLNAVEVGGDTAEILQSEPVVTSSNYGFEMSAGKRYYIKRKGKILLFSSAEQADDYLEAEQQATIAKSRGAKKRVAAKFVKVAPIETIELEPVTELLSRYMPDVSLPNLLKMRDIEQVLMMQHQALMMQDDEDIELLLMTL